MVTYRSDLTRRLTSAEVDANFAELEEKTDRQVYSEAVGDGVTDDTSALQAAIDFVAAAGGGTVFLEPGSYLISSTLNINDHGVMLQGAGAGGFENNIAQLRASAATRIVFADTAVPAPMVKFASRAGEYPKAGGGLQDIMLDGNNRATKCLHVASWRWGMFRRVHLYAATEDNLLTSAIDGTLSATPYDVQYCMFDNVISHCKNQTGNAAYAARLTGGQGGGGAATGNTSFNTFYNCFFNSYNQDALLLEDTDNNIFFGLHAKADASGFKSIVLGCAADDSSGNSAVARYNQFFGCEGVDGILCKAGQVGDASSNNNQFFGVNYSNSAPSPELQTGAGGSPNATAQIYSSTAAEGLNAISVALASTLANVITARGKITTETVRIKNSSSDHIRLESGDGNSEFAININNADGMLRISRVAGSGHLQVVCGAEFVGTAGFNDTAPIAKPTVSGSRGGNAALASLLTALANYGLITDSSSA